MKLIPLTQGLFAKVDDEDFDYLSQFKWCSQKNNNGKVIYAIRNTPRVNGKQKTIRMHIEIMGFKGIDHVDHDGLNNQKLNLRAASKSQNSMNTKKIANVSSIYKGVCWSKTKNKWVAQITLNLKVMHIGYFSSELEAAKAYNARATILFHDFANLNVL